MWSSVKRITAMVLKLGWTLEPPEEFLNLLMPRSNRKSIKTNSGNEIQASLLFRAPRWFECANMFEKHWEREGPGNAQVKGMRKIQAIRAGSSPTLVCIRITWKQAGVFHVAHWRTKGPGPPQVPPIPQVILIHTEVGEPRFQVARNNSKGETKNYEPPQAVTESVPTPLHLMNTTLTWGCTEHYQNQYTCKGPAVKLRHHRPHTHDTCNPAILRLKRHLL